MLRITEEDYNELMDIMDGYVQKLDKLPFGSEEYKNLKVPDAKYMQKLSQILYNQGFSDVLVV